MVGIKNYKVTKGSVKLIREGLNTIDFKTGEITKGYGRWIYCKYCYKNIQPTILEEEFSDKTGKIHKYRMVICNECHSGLTPSKEAV